ncbi:MAG: penicillin-binding protein 2 [Opitutus sp.]|nr:penicillin-binding protein 2 [Opitutus sp.]
MSKGFASNYRIALLASGLLVCFGGLGARLVWLHVINRDELLRSIVQVRRTVMVQKARRGDIRDANDAILATSRSLMVLQVDPSALLETTREKKKWPKLAALIGRPLPELEKIFTTKFREPAPANPATAASPVARPAGLVFNLTAPATPPAPAAEPVADEAELGPTADERGRQKIQWVKLSENISESTYAEIEKLALHGVYTTRVYRRAYPHNQLAAHLIGFVNRKEEAVAGLERYADFYLRGQDGWREGEHDGRGRELAQFRTRDVPRADGYSVKLSIDANVQDIIEQELAAIAQKYSPLKATIIVSRPSTGFILGLANYPTFDPNHYNQIPREEQGSMRNVAVADVYEPGSVFKIIAASAALEEGLVTVGRTFDCSLDRITHKGRSLSLPAEDHHFENPHSVPLAQVISFSSNRGAAQLGVLLGEQRLYNYARAFGFGHPLGFPVGGEVAGIFAKPEKWYPIDITRIPMGQSIAATALQMHQAMSAIASDGVLLRPQIIREIRDDAGEVVYRFDRAELNRAVSAPTARTMARMLMSVASKEGTAPEAAIAGYEVAGKTGTAQKFLPELDAHGNLVLRPSHHHHVVSFVGFFPASDPQVAISVIVDDADALAPGGVAYGSKVAAPSFKRIGEQLIPYLKIKAGHSALAPVFAGLEGGRR